MIWVAYAGPSRSAFSQSPTQGQTDENSLLPNPELAPKNLQKTELATRILHVALHQSVWGPPAWCTVRQRMEAYDQQINAFGKFIRAGKGSGKLSFSLQFPAGDAMNSVHQVSDGQRLQTIESFTTDEKSSSGKRRERSIVDLVKIREHLFINDQNVADPTIAMYLAIGGQAESLRKLCQQYEWFDVQHGRFGGAQVWVLEGRLAQQPPAVRAWARTDIELFGPHNSGLLPTNVRVAIGKASENSTLPYWLYQVDHWSEPRDDPHPYQGRLRLITEWAKPERIETDIDAKLFDASTENDLWEDETERYLPPIPDNLAMESHGPELQLRTAESTGPAERTQR